mgnify:CR=1 FL=1
MSENIRNIAVLTSGGDAPGMNAAIRAVVRACSFYNIECTGVYRGYQGLLDGDFEKLDARSVRNVINKGGTFLKSSRCEDFRKPEGRKLAYDNLKLAGVDALIVSGGNGTFTGAQLLIDEYDFPVVGIPATIDNDINGTDYTLGYDTALNTVVEAIDKIRDTASSHNRLFLIEVMGRDAGDIALNSGVGAGAEEIMIPEESDSMNRLMKSLKISREKGKTSSIIVVAEGDKSGKNVFELADHINDDLEDYNYDIRVSVLGHIQRGGKPSCFDRVLASRLGVGAVETILNGTYNVMMGVERKKVVQISLKDAIEPRHEFDKELRRVADITSV